MASRYCRPTDIITGDATITVPIGTVDPYYPVGNLHDRDPSVPMKVNTMGGVRIVFDFGVPRHVDAIAIPNHNFTPGLSVLVQANTSNVWTDPYINTSFTVGATETDGHCKRPWIDLAAFWAEVLSLSMSASLSPSASRSPSASASLSLSPSPSVSPSASASPSASPSPSDSASPSRSPSGSISPSQSLSRSASISPSPSPGPSPNYRYWSIYVPAGNASPVQFGEILLIETLRTFVRPLTFGVSRTVARGYIPSLVTEYGVKSFYDQNVKQWRFESVIYGTTADLQSMHDLLNTCRGPVYPFLFILDDTIQTDGGYYVRCTPEMAQAWTHRKVGGGTYEMPLTFEEVSRGLPL